ncbi:MAG: hypothetical protein DID92_2727744187 [Candidatus Nitrotoga sp. SPKER]|nr:MAG: hypothetical protein DID92_2727744187 [Candidatus Nitrotoga sp. SPKER]
MRADRAGANRHGLDEFLELLIKDAGRKVFLILNI